MKYTIILALVIALLSCETQSSENKIDSYSVQINSPIDSIYKQHEVVTFSAEFKKNSKSITQVDSVKWVSDKDGILSSLYSFATDELSRGAHRITINSYENLIESTDHKNIEIKAVEYSLKTNVNHEYFLGDTIQFSAEVVNEANLSQKIESISWTSDKSALLSNSQSFEYASLGLGLHKISVEIVLENKDEISDTINVNIKANQYEIVESISGTLEYNELIQFSAVLKKNSELTEFNTIQWESDLDGVLSTELSFSISTLSVGSHNILIKAEDISGEKVEKSFSLEIKGETIRVRSISPNKFRVFVQNDTILFDVNFENKYGDLRVSNNLIWSSNIDGNIGTTSEIRTSQLSYGKHIISLTASFVNGKTVSADLQILIQARELKVESYLANPVAAAIKEMPVVIINYFPSKDSLKLDKVETGWDNHGVEFTIQNMIDRTMTFNRRIKFMLEEGSRYRGYKNPSAQAYLGYKVVKIINFYEKLPRGFPAGGTNEFFPDYNEILEKVNAEDLVNNQNVKEFWLWGYHHGEIVPVESNMSSPTTGDISNSNRNNADMPIYDKTYVLYNYNFTRTQSEAVHNHGHHLEVILDYINNKQDGNTTLFWDKFVGRVNGTFTLGRAGWTHMPPNTIQHYDYENSTSVSSDIEDWKPDNSGTKKLVNVNTWGNLTYNWPNETDFHQRKEAQWYIYWMQNFPGFQNTIPYESSTMENWWIFTADWDNAINDNKGLYR